LVGTEIDYRHGAFLGIGCQPGENGCVIYTVRPNTAADKGGLQIKDVIYEYGGKPVSDFEQLTAMIAENRAGDTVTVKVLRQGEKLEKRVTLGQWE
jgi:S1-C subfamily serine protease